LVDLINKIKQLGLELQDLVTALAKLEAALKELLSKLGGLDSERSLLEAEDKLNNLDGILEGLNEDLNKLTKLTKKIEPEATEEEESFIDQSNKDITNLWKLHKNAVDSIKKAWVLLKQVKDSVSKKAKSGNLKPADIQAISAETAKVDERLVSVTAEVMEVSEGVQRRKDGYNSLNLEAKLWRRDKQLNEVVGYIGEVEKSISELLNDITTDLVAVEENKNENKEMFVKMNAAKDSCEKCNRLITDLRGTSAEI